MMSKAPGTLTEMLPRVAACVHGGLERRAAELERLGMPLLWRLERDLALLQRHIASSDIARAYRALLSDPNSFIQAAHEIRVAALLQPRVTRIELAPLVGAGRCDLAVEACGEKLWIEVTTHEDRFPKGLWNPESESGGIVEELRATIEPAFATASDSDAANTRRTPASQDLRQRIRDEAKQLPTDAPTLVVLGNPAGCSEDTAAALFGDSRLRMGRNRPPLEERVANGLFRVADDVGGISRLSAVVWLRLAPRWSDIHVHGRIFPNPRAATPLPSPMLDLLNRVFDRGAVLREELDRIISILQERYHPERIIVFGSLGQELQGREDRVHDSSDIDLVVVKETAGRMADRIREVLDTVQPRVALNVLVYTPREFDRMEREGHHFVRDEIVGRGVVVYQAS